MAVQSPGVDEVDVSEMLSLQLTEIEMLASMFPNPGEFQLDDPSAVATIQAFVDGELQREDLHSRIGFTVKVDTGNKVTVLQQLVCWTKVKNWTSGS